MKSRENRTVKQEKRPEIIDFYHKLYDSYGSRNWWPADEPFEVIIGAILTQNTAWKNVEKAIGNLKRGNLLSPEGLSDLPENELAALIRPSGYYNQKAKKIKAFLDYYKRFYNNDLTRMSDKPLEALREELLDIFGIGEETADCILLYALEKPSFVIDAYTKRIFSRIGWCDEKISYTELKSMIEQNIPVDIKIYNEFHALIVYHGKEYCRKIPACDLCAVNDLCGEYKSGNSNL